MTRARYDFEISSCRKQLQDARGVVAREKAQEELQAAGAACDLEEGLEDALKRAKALARPGDAVLLSPGCASFDDFDSFEHRGRVFAALSLGERC